VINTEDLDDGGLCGRAVPAVSHPGLKGSGPSGHEQTSASHRPTGEKRSQEPPGDPTPMHCHRNTPNQRPNALTRPTAVMAAFRFLLAMPLAFSGFNGPMPSGVQRQFTAISKAWKG
jgi:hypothetical protein